MSDSPTIDQRLSDVSEQVAEEIAALLPEADQPEAPLYQAMRAACGGGKRLRPLLVMLSSELFGVATDRALRVAASVEFAHNYALIHDDLPAMDDAELRRGQPTIHRAFDEATAILAGDALQALAFEVLADPATHEDPAVRCRLVAELAGAIGAHGMVGGQMLDLIGEIDDLDAPTITRMQRLKTGELIAFAATSGAMLGRASPKLVSALHNYAHDLGLAFQITDDVLDVTGREEEIGKNVGRDANAGKSTFVSILGVERARAQAEMLSQQAIRHLDPFEARAAPLRDLADYLLNRRV